MKQSIKTESVQEFLARGGQITKCDTKMTRKRQPRSMHEDNFEEVESEVDFSALPTALKIRFGIKD